MFEIRVICDPADTECVTRTLNDAFDTGPVREHRTRDGARLYLTARQRPAHQPWPTPEQAYKAAPDLVEELGWVTHTAADADCFSELERDYYLRKAALMDRIALDTQHPEDIETAEAAALMLLDTDRHGLSPDDLHRGEADPRGYVRHTYTQPSQHTA